MIRLDLWILDRFYQPATDWINDLAGVNCFRQARIIWNAALLSIMLHTAFVSPTMEHIGVDILLIIPLTLFQVWIISQDEAEQSKKPDLMNKRRMYHSSRIFSILFFSAMDIADLGDLWHIVLDAILISAMYVGACTPRPPKPKTQTKLALETG